MDINDINEINTTGFSGTDPEVENSISEEIKSAMEATPKYSAEAPAEPVLPEDPVEAVTDSDLSAAMDAAPRYSQEMNGAVVEEPQVQTGTPEDLKAAMDAVPIYNTDAPLQAPEEDPSLADTADLDETDLAAEVKRARPDYAEPWREPAYTATSDSVRAYSPNRYEGGTYTPRKTKKKRSGFGRWLAAALAMAILCGLAGGGAAYMVTRSMLKNNEAAVGRSVGNQVVIGGTTTESKSNGESSSAKSVRVTGEELTAAQLYEMACQQVVGVNTSVNTTNLFGQTTSSAVSGSGFIISEDGYIMTNYHVIEYAAVYKGELTVIMHDGTTYPAEIIGYESENDVAVIKIDAEGLNPVTFGSSENMVVGEDIYAVGNPLGELQFTMTKGMVSALDRYITTDSKTTINMFQIDAAVNSGNSGGPVYNTRGEVIGIVTAKYSDTGVEGLGFAIPIDDAVSISTQLIEQGYVSGKAFLGVNVQDITETYAYYLNLPRGAYIYSINDGSCAQTAGLRVGDVITAVGD